MKWDERHACEIYIKRKYADSNIAEMMKRYAPPSNGNDTATYIKNILSHANISESVKIKDLPDEKIQLILNAIEKHEGSIKGKEQWLDTTTITISDGSRPISNEHAQVKLGNKTYEMETDRFGRLPLIAHDETRKEISISTKNANGEYEKVYQAAIVEVSKSILLIKNFVQFSAHARLHDPKIILNNTQ